MTACACHCILFAVGGRIFQKFSKGLLGLGEIVSSIVLHLVTNLNFFCLR